MGVSVFAKTETLLYLTPNTYITNEHGDSYFSDTYTGFLSINGSEKIDGTMNTPYWVSITYNVQGDYTKRKLYAKGKKL